VSTDARTAEEAAALTDEAARLAALETRFAAALSARRAGDAPGAADLLRSIRAAEPRLAEPRIELAHILLEAGQAAEAEEEVREALRHLDSDGQWTDDVPEPVLQSIAWSILAEALRVQADDDAVVFGDPAEWSRLMDESAAAWAKAATLDPSNALAAEMAFGMDRGRSIGARPLPDAEAVRALPEGADEDAELDAVDAAADAEHDDNGGDDDDSDGGDAPR
jgi:tetratricopeptide (TPR) repeat protein